MIAHHLLSNIDRSGLNSFGDKHDETVMIWKQIIEKKLIPLHIKLLATTWIFYSQNIFPVKIRTSQYIGFPCTRQKTPINNFSFNLEIQ